MAKIQFLIWPEKGHLNSTFKLAKALQSRGHTVIYSQLFVLEEYIRAQGLDFAPLFAELFPKGYEVHRNHKIGIHDEVAKSIKQHAMDPRQSGQDLFRNELVAIFEKLKPELLVMDATFARPLLPVRRQSDPPCIMLHTTIRNPYDHITFPLASSMITLFMCPEEFELPQQPRMPQVRYVEAACDLLRKQTRAFPWNRVDDSRKLLYCSLGTQTHWAEGWKTAWSQQTLKRFLQAVVDAMATRPDWQLVMAHGIQFRAEDFQSVTPDALLVSEAPQLEILKRASLVITHGGFNTVKECIFFGVPMLVFPLTEDQPANAARVEHHGLGVVANIETASGESIGLLIDRIDRDPGFKSRVDAMKEVFLRVEREQPAVRIIEDMLGVKNGTGIAMQTVAG